MMRRLIAAVRAGLIRRAYLSLAIAVGLATVAFPFAAKLRLESDIASLLPDSLTSVQTLDKIKAKVGGFETLQLLVQGDDFPSMVSYATALEVALESNPLVNAVDWRKDVDFFSDHALLYIDIFDLRDIRRRVERRFEQERLKRNPLYIDFESDTKDAAPASEEKELLDFADLESKYNSDERRYYTNDDKTVLVLNVYPTGSNSNVSFAKRFYREIRSTVESLDTTPYGTGLFVEYGGSFKNKIDEYSVILDDVRTTAWVGIVCIFALILLYFRRLVALPVVGLPLVISLLWTFALAYAFIGNLNTFTVFLFVVLFGLGIDFGIHMLSRYLEERRNGAVVDAALDTTLRDTGSAMTTAALTTSAAFFSLMLAEFRGFYEFGFIAGGGVLLSLFATFACAPGILKAAERLGLLQVPPPTQHPLAIARYLALRPWPVFALGCLLAGLGVWATSHIEFEYEFRNLNAELPASQEVKRKLKTVFNESNSPALVLVDGVDDLADVAAYVAERKANDPSPTIDKFKSVLSLLPEDQERKMREIERIREVLADPRVAKVQGPERADIDRLYKLASVSPLTIADLPESMLRIFRDREGNVGNFGYILPSVRLLNGLESMKFSDDVGTFVAPSGKTYHAANTSILLADLLRLIRREGARAVMLTLLVVLLLVTLDLRSLRDGLIVMSPLILGVLWVFAWMYFNGWKLNFFNIVAIPSIIGIGIDNGVHLFHRMRAADDLEQVAAALVSTGGAIAASSLTSVVGFAGLMFAHHGGLNAIGDLAVTGILLTLLAALTMLAAMMRVRAALRR